LARSFFGWLKDRQKSKIMNMAREQMSRSIDTVAYLNKCITAYSKGKISDAKKLLELLFLEEEEIDELRRFVFEELSISSLPPKYRQDLMQLVRRLDRLADFIKDSARSLIILMETTFPKEIMNLYVRMSNNLMDCSLALHKSILAFQADPFLAKELVKQVDFYEERVDEDYVKMKLLFMKYSKDIDVATIIELRVLMKLLEESADICTDTADYIFTLATLEGFV
jgi:predicted phosphate transport protein (TIGR00153 family)